MLTPERVKELRKLFEVEKEIGKPASYSPDSILELCDTIDELREDLGKAKALKFIEVMSQADKEYAEQLAEIDKKYGTIEVHEKQIGSLQAQLKVWRDTVAKVEYDLKLNASMLARQTDMARDAETKLAQSEMRYVESRNEVCAIGAQYDEEKKLRHSVMKSISKLIEIEADEKAERLDLQQRLSLAEAKIATIQKYHPERPNWLNNLAMPKREHLLTGEQGTEILCYLDRADIDLSDARKALEKAIVERDEARHFHSNEWKDRDQAQKERDQAQKERDEKQNILNAIEEVAVQACIGPGDDLKKHDRDCVGCRIYTLAHGSDRCAGGDCPVMHSGIKQAKLYKEKVARYEAIEKLLTEAVEILKTEGACYGWMDYVCRDIEKSKTYLALAKRITKLLEDTRECSVCHDMFDQDDLITVKPNPPHRPMESLCCGSCYDEHYAGFVPSPNPEKVGLQLVMAGVDENHQTDHCDDCKVSPEDKEELIRTCSHTEYLTLCRSCYLKRGSGVR